jgi:hypothetical protein
LIDESRDEDTAQQLRNGPRRRRSSAVDGSSSFSLVCEPDSPSHSKRGTFKTPSLQRNTGQQDKIVVSSERTSDGKETRAQWKDKQLQLWIHSIDPKGSIVAKPEDEGVELSAPSNIRSRASALKDFARLQKKSGNESHRSLISRVQGKWRSLVMFVDHSLPILNPNTRGKIAWDLFIMSFVLFCAITVPLDISYGLPTTDNIFNILNWSINLVFAVDICVNFRTAYFDNQGYLVRDSDRIATNYLKLWFWIDLFATLPYDLLAMAFGMNGGGVQTTVLQFLKTPRLLRLGRLVRILDRVKNVNWLRVAILIFGMIFMSHWLACVWYMMYQFCTFPEGQSIYDWSFYVASEDGSIPAYYLNAYYQSFLLIVGNYQVPSNNAERVFFIIVGILGTCFYAAAVGQMSVLIANMSIVSLRHKQKRDMTMDVLRYTGASEADQKRVEGYFDYVTQYSHPTNEGMQFVYELPKALYQDIAGLLFKEALTRMPFFKDLEEAFLTAVSLKMKIVTYTPREVIFM